MQNISGGSPGKNNSKSLYDNMTNSHNLLYGCCCSVSMLVFIKMLFSATCSTCTVTLAFPRFWKEMACETMSKDFAALDGPGEVYIWKERKKERDIENEKISERTM